MDITRVIKTLLISISSISLGMMLLLVIKQQPTPDRTGEFWKYRNPILIEGITTTTIEKGLIVNRFQADKLEVKPRKYYIFNVKPFKEIRVINAKLEYHLNEETISKTRDLFSPDMYLSHAKGTSGSLKGLGVITRGVVKGLVLKVLKDDIPILSVSSDEAKIDLKNKKTELFNTRLEEPTSGKIITSDRITWDSNEMVFKIPGRYLAESPKGKARGSRIQVDVNFNVSKLR